VYGNVGIGKKGAGVQGHAWLQEKKGEVLRRVGGEAAGYGYLRMNKKELPQIGTATRKGTYG
jgi:hypothetical protein